jgi:glycosyltransferase involved in cell wall biosynthesis
MKIAILGTKGIPNNYGGFEQFAEYLSTGLINLGHSVTVYNPSYHPYKELTFKGVDIKRIFSPEKYLGSAANFIYDHLCLRHALKQNFDIIYEAGYHSVAISFVLLAVRKIKNPILITNMDGLEWKRSKWNGPTQRLIIELEKIAVRNSPYLISDNEGIRNYYLTQFNKDSYFLPYGADPVENINLSDLEKYNLIKHEYFILVARLEPENNIEPVIEGYLNSASEFPLIIIGGYQTSYGKYLRDKNTSINVRFLGGIYNKIELDSLRHFSIAYFHGHSVGGTNPSLLEAMACNCFIVAHMNEFNKSVLGESALYFLNSAEVKHIIIRIHSLRCENFLMFESQNSNRLATEYSWNSIVEKHENLFLDLIEKERILSIIENGAPK